MANYDGMPGGGVQSARLRFVKQCITVVPNAPHNELSLDLATP